MTYREGDYIWINKGDNQLQLTKVEYIIPTRRKPGYIIEINSEDGLYVHQISDSDVERLATAEEITWFLLQQIDH